MDNLISINENGIHFTVILTDEQEAEFNRLMQDGIQETEALDQATTGSMPPLNLQEV